MRSEQKVERSGLKIEWTEAEQWAGVRENHGAERGAGGSWSGERTKLAAQISLKGDASLLKLRVFYRMWKINYQLECIINTTNKKGPGRRIASRRRRLVIIITIIRLTTFFALSHLQGVSWIVMSAISSFILRQKLPCLGPPLVLPAVSAEI